MFEAYVIELESGPFSKFNNCPYHCFVVIVTS